MSDRELTPEEEDTWRTLKDEPLILKTRCKWGLHRWTVWKLDEDIRASSHYDRTTYYMISTCADCNIPRWKKIKRPVAR